jgi:nucleoside-diphosphate-sugar epimerase
MIGTNSHVMGPNDDKDSFLQVTLQKLIDGDELIFSTGEQIFDVISSYDCALAYKLIGEKGKSHGEYWIGSGEARPLKEYVKIMASLYPSGQELQFGKFQYNDISLTLEDFSIQKLSEDTGFTPTMSYEKTVHQLYDWLTKGVY